MANELDELQPNSFVGPEGNDVNVIQKQIPVKTGFGSILFQIILWVLGIIPGLVFLIMKIKAATFLQQLQQKIQHDASQIDNYMEQRVQILTNCAQLINKAVDLDKDTFVKIAQHRGGKLSDEERNALSADIDAAQNKIQIAFENYPDLQAHSAIQDAMQQNNYLQREITAARELYNDSVAAWNIAIFAWPTKMIVASKKKYTTRIPFATTAEIKQQARGTFF